MPNLVQHFDGTVDVQQIDLTGVLDQVLGILPYVLVPVIGFIAVRKGISFVLGMLKSA